MVMVVMMGTEGVKGGCVEMTEGGGGYKGDDG